MNSTDKKFSIKIQVVNSHIDFQGHVSNVALLEMMNQASIEHSISAGWGPREYRNLGGMMVVRRNEIDYKAQAFLGEELRVETWVQEMVGKRAIRCHRIVRVRDGKEIAASVNYWTYVNLHRGAPEEIPASLKAAFISPGHETQSAPAGM